MKDLHLQTADIQERMARILEKDNRTDPTIREDLEELLSIAEHEENHLVEGYCCAHLASYCYLHENNQTKFNELIKRAFTLTQDTQDDEEIAFVCNLLAIDAANNGIYPLSLDYYLMGLRHTDANPHRAANLLCNIGGNYWRLGDYENAIRYTRQALDLSKTFTAELCRVVSVGE